MSDDGHAPALQAVGLAKTFGGVRALKGVDLTIEPGEVHALLGENGSGKSTFIKILSGYHVPDEGGRVAIDGAEVTFGSAESAYTNGCRFVHQDLGLVGTSSVLDNILLNAGFPSHFGTIKGREAMRSVREDLARVGLEQVDPRTPVAALTPALKTGVAVARALRYDVHHPARLVVLDEPTATLPENEVRHLLEIVRRRRGDRRGRLVRDPPAGRGVRGGRQRHGVPRRAAGRHAADEHPQPALAHQPAHRQRARRDPRGVRAPALRARRARSCASPIWWPGRSPVCRSQVRPGDVLGIAGITGSGRETLLSAIFGAQHARGRHGHRQRARS